MQASEIAARVKAAPAGGVKIGVALEEELYPYQANDIAWMVAQRQGLIASELGTGKTIIAIGLAQYLKQHGRLDGMLVLVPGAEIPYQWEEEIARWAPGLRVVVGRGKDRLHRSRLYASRWDVLVVNYETARNDTDALRSALRGRANVLYCDEATAFKSHGSKTAQMVRALSPMFPYKFAVTATPIQQGLEDLHGICDALGFGELVGTLGSFRRAYCIRERVDFYVKARGGGSMKRSKMVTVGYRNVDELRERMEPWTIRRKRTDSEVEKYLPAVQMQVVRLELRPRQRVAYQALLRGIQIELRDGEVKPTYIEAAAKFARLLGASDGLRTIDPQMHDESAKSDWLLDRLQNAPDWQGEKVVVFSRLQRSIAPIADRLLDARIGYATFMGTQHYTNQAERTGELERFRSDPECRVLLATQAVEMGLNLQQARIMVFYSIIPNPKRLEQIMGRIARAGSTFASVMGFTLLTRGTVEEALYESVVERNAVADYYWSEESALFARLGTDRLLQIIRGARIDDE